MSANSTVSHTHQVTPYGCLPLPDNSVPGLVGGLVCIVQTKAGEWAEEIPVNLCSIAYMEYPLSCTIITLEFPILLI